MQKCERRPGQALWGVPALRPKNGPSLRMAEQLCRQEQS